MKFTQISYTVKPEKIQEHISLVEAVFRELSRNGLADMKYICYQTPDHTFVHIAQFGNEAVNQAFTDLPAFREFRKNLNDRIIDAPVSRAIAQVGYYSATV
jgi:hypothetical protein